jgi:hypothetical protein
LVTAEKARTSHPGFSLRQPCLVNIADCPTRLVAARGSEVCIVALRRAVLVFDVARLQAS